jgi:hypothetical protein
MKAILGPDFGLTRCPRVAATISIFNGFQTLLMTTEVVQQLAL